MARLIEERLQKAGFTRPFIEHHTEWLMKHKYFREFKYEKDPMYRMAMVWMDIRFLVFQTSFLDELVIVKEELMKSTGSEGIPDWLIRQWFLSKDARIIKHMLDMKGLLHMKRIFLDDELLGKFLASMKLRYDHTTGNHKW